ncbi:aminoacyl-tRNA hydrolase [Tianweitania populi]|uniref:Peptidyl-tRNA hydrolase n=1 Tax=Tianweitania populi TaxID=1607949 RepID=A0A8J3DPH7_9HYPH|nr:aminoacyl-tRNA hydrolase [Tianweitania populi]GHD11783.1 peptidyl-tRNA hydrolase [Tianweitania populi]
MRIFAGLGNPGAQYQDNRHNVGFMAADAIARRHSFAPWTKKFHALICEGTIGGEKVLLMKPQTFMNNSGQSVGEAARFYKIEPGDISILYDELDLAPAKIRVKIGGGNGGHNGIRSADAHLPSKDYRRVRIGIGHPGAKELVHNWVLGNFAKADQTWLDPLLEAIADNADLLAKGDDNGFMNKVALATPCGAREPKPYAKGEPQAKPATPPKGQSHIRQARPAQPQIKVPESGPMAAMLKKLLGRE